jgi:hypothetical protein
MVSHGITLRKTRLGVPQRLKPTVIQWRLSQPYASQNFRTLCTRSKDPHKREDDLQNGNLR